MSLAQKLALALLLALALIATFLLIPSRDRMDWAACAPLYEAAQTAADTARVDAQPASRQRGRDQEPAPPTCGELRVLRKR
jgi:hypothetical protein